MIRCCGVRHHLHEIDPSIPNVYPCCDCPDETTGHIILCPNKDRTTLYNKSVQELVKWMHSVQTSPVLIRMIGKYLDARNTMSMIETLNEVEYETTHLESSLAEDHDNIGWQNFTEGRISKLYVEYQRSYYKTLKDVGGMQ